MSEVFTAIGYLGAVFGVAFLGCVVVAFVRVVWESIKKWCCA